MTTYFFTIVNRGNEKKSGGFYGCPYVHGKAYGHIAVVVDDVAAEHARFEREGLEPRKLIDMKHDGRPLAKLFFVTDPDGYEIEVLQKQGRYR